LRTVVPDRGRYTDIYVGVSIGGKREVNPYDWATFEIDPTLLDGIAGKTLMPENYYVLGDPITMRVRQESIAVADVKISFTEDFYADPLSLTNTYVIPFRLLGTSCDVIPEGKDFTLVCVNYVSSFSGTYYVRGKKVQVADANGTAMDNAVPVEYYNKDISANFTRSVVSLGLNDLRRTGLAETNASAGANDRDKLRARFTLTPASADSDYDYDVAVTTGDDDAGTAVTPLPIVSGSGKFYNAPFDVYETHLQARFEVSYIYQDGANYFKVDEELIRRRDPYLDLRVVEW
jgi:hypothetical protein